MVKSSNLLVDLVGSSLFSNARNNVFKGLNTRHRHYSCSMLMVSQGYKYIKNYKVGKSQKLFERIGPV